MCACARLFPGENRPLLRMIRLLLLVCSLSASLSAGAADVQEPVAVLEAHSDNIYWLTVDRKGNRLLSASADNTAKVWDLAERRALLTIEHDSPVYAGAFSPGGRLIATCAGDGRVVLWQADDGVPVRVLEGHTAPVYSVVFSEDGAVLASGSGEPENDCILWDVASGRLLARGRGHQRPVYGVALSKNWLATSSSDQTIRLWRSPDLGEARILQGHSSDVYRCGFSADGSLLASVSQDKSVRLWDVASGQTRWVLEGHRDPVYGVAFSPDGETLATAGDDRSLRLWDVRSGQERAVWKEAHREAIFAIAFAPDGALFSAGAEGKIHIWKRP